MKLLKLTLPVLAFATSFAVAPDDADASTRNWRRPRAQAVPELSVGAAGTALALLGGGVMVMLGRRRRRDRA
jgi:hypothetical protein